jgi:hypothetical protein
MNKWNYKNKLVLLGIAAIVLFFIIYKMAICETIAIRQKTIDYTEQLNSIQKAPQEIGRIKRKLDNFADIVGKTMDTTYRNEPLLEFLSQVCKTNQVTLSDYMSPHISEQVDFRVETRIAVIEGRFMQLLKTLNSVEQNYKRGKTVAADFNLKEDLRTNQRRLYLTIYIQSVINKKVTGEPNKL